MADGEWRANWIWGPSISEEGDARSRHCYFRGTLEAPGGELSAAVLSVCADTRYRLWVNGRMLGHGPARSHPGSQYFDVYDVRDLLHPGSNTFAVLATHYGIGTCYSCLGSPGFLLQADIENAQGETQTFGTDARWRAASAPYGVGYERMSIQLAYPEVFDARREPEAWNLPGFDDSSWEFALNLGPVGMEPWIEMLPRDIPPPFFRGMAPVRVQQVGRVRLQATARTDENITPAEDMERATTLEVVSSESVSFRHPALLTVAPQSGQEGVSVVLDFGKEVSGFPLLVVRKGAGGRVDIGYSERIEADGTVNPNHWGGCDVHYADRLIMRPGFQRYQPLDHRAFRYVRLDFYDCPEPVEILVEMTVSGYPVEHKGEFQCSDALLQRIWEVGRYTTELCMDDGFMDCPWRERGQWLGDVRVEGLVAVYAFGDSALARKALLQYPQSQDDSGWFRGIYPADPPFDPILPTFCFLWPVALWEYFLHSNDRTLLESVWPNLERLIAALKACVDTDGLLQDPPGWVFVDWAPLNTAGKSTAVNAFAYDALRASGKIARALGYPDRGGELDILAEDIRESVNDSLWDRTRGCYIDGIVQGERSRIVSEQSNVLAALVGLADHRQTEAILRALGYKAYLLSDQRPDVDRSEIVTIATPYFAFYLLRLLYGCGLHDRALAYIREKWGAMLDRGATTFWEQWEPHWSLCHAWSAAPTVDLMAEIAGIRPLQPGFEEFTVDLRPGSLSWLKAVVPTPRGNISVAYHYRTTAAQIDPMGAVIPGGAPSPAITVNLTAPTGSRAHVRIPLLGLSSPSVRLNGKSIWKKGVPDGGSGDKFVRDGDAIAFSILGGRYHIELERD